jgi:hypothetical protein
MLSRNEFTLRNQCLRLHFVRLFVSGGEWKENGDNFPLENVISRTYFSDLWVYHVTCVGITEVR